MSYFSQLNLQNFRCYDQARLDHLESGLLVFCGPNGAGKTNILEAISMFTPGRGIRSAKVMEMQKNDASNPWGLAATVQTTGGDVKIGTGLIQDSRSGKEKRTIRINGVTAKAQTSLLDYLSCLWLTPQMDRIFIEGSSARRRFLDRLIFSFDSGHSGRVTRYENAMRQRSKILQSETPDKAWVTGLEAQMAETGVAIAAARLDFTQRLQAFCNQTEREQEKFFPKAVMDVRGSIEELLKKTPAAEVERIFIYQLEQAQEKDAIVGGAAVGPHKSDLAVLYADKNMAAAQCSTGEQKALLIGIILSHAQLMMSERGAPPVLLLDEIAAHLDEDRRDALFRILLQLGGQVFMTGTDPLLFESIQEKSQFFDVCDAQITPAKTSLAA